MAFEDTLKNITLDADASLVAKTGVGAFTQLAISQASLTSNVVTITTAIPHGLLVGQSVQVTGTASSVINGTAAWVIASVPSPTTFTYAKTNADIGNQGAGGLVTATVPNPAGLQYRFVKVTGQRTCGLVTANTDYAVGVLQSKPQVAGQAATVGFHGISMVAAGAAITIASEARVSTDSVGRAVPFSANQVYGIALQDATVVNQLIPVLLRVS